MIVGRQQRSRSRGPRKEAELVEFPSRLFLQTLSISSACGKTKPRGPKRQRSGATARAVHLYLRCGFFTQNRGRTDRQGTGGGSFRRPRWKRKAPATG